MKDKDTYGDATGGLIEETFTGTLDTGARTNNIITISGSFSVVRKKDRKRF